MTPQDFKALLDVLNRIATALEGKEKNVAVETVNRFAEVYRILETLINEYQNLTDDETLMFLQNARKTHVKIANEILQINQQK
jgi:hypothetical protein